MTTAYRVLGLLDSNCARSKGNSLAGDKSCSKAEKHVQQGGTAPAALRIDRICSKKRDGFWNENLGTRPWKIHAGLVGGYIKLDGNARHGAGKHGRNDAW